MEVVFVFRFSWCEPHLASHVQDNETKFLGCFPQLLELWLFVFAAGWCWPSMCQSLTQNLIAFNTCPLIPDYGLLLGGLWLIHPLWSEEGGQRCLVLIARQPEPASPAVSQGNVIVARNLQEVWSLQPWEAKSGVQMDTALGCRTSHKSTHIGAYLNCAKVHENLHLTQVTFGFSLEEN